MSSAAAFGAVFVTLLVGHQVADHWVQTSCQARDKGRPGWVGRLACARHVATYTATLTGLLTLAIVALDLPVGVLGVTAGQTISAVTHYWADRRTTLAALARVTDKHQFHALGAPRPGHDDNNCLGTGAYALDQSWHLLWLWVAALATTLVTA
uniref:DUF3307 domain-containing protein n=1 Tax=Actinokineospora sp. CA-119265 TaxID=3239890 RepID=UPI003F496875